MQTTDSVSIREYLSTSYRPDCDYVDGAVLERNVGEFEHGRLQGALVVYFWLHRTEWGTHAYPEVRVQVKPNRFRIPDVLVVRGPEPFEAILTSPPLICIEILSGDDRLSQMQERIDDYLTFGVTHVWILDPLARKAFVCTRAGIQEVSELRTDTPAIVIPLDALFE